MPSPTAIPVRLDRPAVHIDAPPGTEIVLEGAFHSDYDGSIVDAAGTTFAGEPLGDTAGLIDLVGGGFYPRERDATTHVVHAIATENGGETCAAHGVAAPCLLLRLPQQAHSRLLSSADWAASLKGGMRVEVLGPPVVPPATVPYLGFASGLLVLGAAIAAAWVVRTRRAGSPDVQLARLARRVKGKIAHADAVLAAPLAPAVSATLKALAAKHVDAKSSEGKRIAEVLRSVETRLDASAEEVRALAEHAAADELVEDIESALEAVDEVAPPR